MGHWGVFFIINSPFHCSPFCLWIADDPYYCGLRARVSNFVKNKNTNEKPVKELGTEIKMKMTPHVGTYQAALSHGHPMQTHQMWHSRSFDSGMGNWVWQLFLMHKLFERSQRKSFIPGWHVLWYYGVALNHDIFFLRFIIIFPYKKTHLIQTFPFLWLASTSASSFPSARLLYAISLILQVKEKIMIIKRGENMKLPIFQSKENLFFFFSFAYTQRIQSSNREKGNRQKRKKWFPLFIDLISPCFFPFFVRETHSLAAEQRHTRYSTVMESLSFRTQSYVVGTFPSPWIQPRWVLSPVPIPYRTLWIPP